MGINTRDGRIEVHPHDAAVITTDIGQRHMLISNFVPLSYDKPVGQVFADTLNTSSDFRAEYQSHAPRVQAAVSAAAATGGLPSSNEPNTGSPSAAAGATNSPSGKAL